MYIHYSKQLAGMKNVRVGKVIRGNEAKTLLMIYLLFNVVVKTIWYVCLLCFWIAAITFSLYFLAFKYVVRISKTIIQHFKEVKEKKEQQRQEEF